MIGILEWMHHLGRLPARSSWSCRCWWFVCSSVQKEYLYHAPSRMSLNIRCRGVAGWTREEA